MNICYLMMVVCLTAIKLGRVKQPRKIVKVKHRVVLTMFAIERNVLTQIHILEMIGDKAAIAPLDPFTEFVEYLFL